MVSSYICNCPNSKQCTYMYIHMYIHVVVQRQRGTMQIRILMVLICRKDATKSAKGLYMCSWCRRALIVPWPTCLECEHRVLLASIVCYWQASCLKNVMHYNTCSCCRPGRVGFLSDLETLSRVTTDHSSISIHYCCALKLM